MDSLSGAPEGPGGDSALRAARAAAYENTRPELRALIPPGTRRVLDLGCASGAVGEQIISDLGAEVIGIEMDPAYASAAKARLSDVVSGDLAELAKTDLTSRLGIFDCLLAGDVLEHLVDPWQVLRKFAGVLEPGGTAIVSLPNARYWDVFMQLGIRGTWPRRSQGIFDRDHLRWFTVADGTALVEHADLTPVEVVRTYRFKPDGPVLDKVPAWVERTPIRPFLAFQFAVVARKEHGQAVSAG